MDGKDLEDVERLAVGLNEAHRNHALVVRLLPTVDTTKLKNGWIDDAWSALDNFMNALRIGQNLILKTPPPEKRARRAKRATAREAVKNTPSRPKTPRPDLAADPSSIPGAIRIVLAKSEKGLVMSELVEAVNAVRTGIETPQPLVSSAVHHMRKRGEIAREGFGRNFRYRLVAAPPEAADTTEEASAD